MIVTFFWELDLFKYITFSDCFLVYRNIFSGILVFIICRIYHQKCVSNQNKNILTHLVIRTYYAKKHGNIVGSKSRATQDDNEPSAAGLRNFMIQIWVGFIHRIYKN